MTTSETGKFTSPDYLEALSLYCAPYENRLDPKFFYAGTALMQRLDLLTHLTQFGESVVVVTGPPGSGKSTLLRAMNRMNDFIPGMHVKGKLESYARMKQVRDEYLATIPEDEAEKRAAVPALPMKSSADDAGMRPPKPVTFIFRLSGSRETSKPNVWSA